MSGDTTVVSGTWSASAAAVIGTVQPQSYDREVKLIAITGPTSSTLRIYRGYAQIQAMSMTSVFPADFRTYDASTQGAITIRAGEAATFAWTGGASGAGQTATAVIESETK
jgi:hypothetical protein